MCCSAGGWYSNSANTSRHVEILATASSLAEVEFMSRVSSWHGCSSVALVLATDPQLELGLGLRLILSNQVLAHWIVVVTTTVLTILDIVTTIRALVVHAGILAIFLARRVVLANDFELATARPTIGLADFELEPGLSLGYNRLAVGILGLGLKLKARGLGVLVEYSIWFRKALSPPDLPEHVGSAALASAVAKIVEIHGVARAGRASGVEATARQWKRAGFLRNLLVIFDDSLTLSTHGNLPSNTELLDPVNSPTPNCGAESTTTTVAEHTHLRIPFYLVTK